MFSAVHSKLGATELYNISIDFVNREEDEANKGGKTFTDIATEAFAEGELKASGIAFDVSQFKARKEVENGNPEYYLFHVTNYY